MIKLSKEKEKRLGEEYSPEQMMHGVFNTLHKRGFNPEQSNRIVYDYLKYIGADTSISVEAACIEIQKDFDSFIRFVREVPAEVEKEYPKTFEEWNETGIIDETDYNNINH